MSAADSPDPSHGLVSAPADALPCVILIGMAGSGKSTIGARLALEMDWAFLDSDHLMEALYGCRLQDLTDALDRDAFLDVECAVSRATRALCRLGGPALRRRQGNARPLRALDTEPPAAGIPDRRRRCGPRCPLTPAAPRGERRA